MVYDKFRFDEISVFRWFGKEIKGKKWSDMRESEILSCLK